MEYSSNNDKKTFYEVSSLHQKLSLKIDQSNTVNWTFPQGQRTKRQLYNYLQLYSTSQSVSLQYVVYTRYSSFSLSKYSWNIFCLSIAAKLGSQGGVSKCVHRDIEYGACQKWLFSIEIGVKFALFLGGVWEEKRAFVSENIS